MRGSHQQAVLNWDLRKACQNGMYARAVKLIAEGADVNADLGWTSLLWEACRGGLGGGDFRMATMLLKAGARDETTLYQLICFLPHYQPTPLAMLEVIRLLIECGCGVNFKGPSGISTLDEAIRSGCVDVVKILFENGACVENCDDPLLFRMRNRVLNTWNGGPDTMRLLLELGADPNDTDRDGCSLVERLAMDGNEELLQALFDHQKQFLPNYDDDESDDDERGEDGGDDGDDDANEDGGEDEEEDDVKDEGDEDGGDDGNGDEGGNDDGGDEDGEDEEEDEVVGKDGREDEDGKGGKFE